MTKAQANQTIRRTKQFLVLVEPEATLYWGPLARPWLTVAIAQAAQAGRERVDCRLREGGELLKGPDAVVKRSFCVEIEQTTGDPAGFAAAACEVLAFLAQQEGVSEIATFPALPGAQYGLGLKAAR